MAVVFVIGKDWTLRAAVRAELLEQGVEARGFETVEDAGAALAGGAVPEVIVLDAASVDLSHPALRALVARGEGLPDAAGRATHRVAPTVLVVASALEEPAALPGAIVLPRPVRIAEIVAAVRQILQGQAA